jgi:hypothetical protein
VTHDKLHIEAELPPSVEFAERAILYALAGDFEATLLSARGVQLSPFIFDIAASAGFDIESGEDRIHVRRQPSLPKPNSLRLGVEDGDIYERLIVSSAVGCGRCPVDLMKMLETCDEASLVARRLGVTASSRTSEDSDGMSLRLIPQDVVKYKLPPKNNHLLNVLLAGVVASGCKLELRSEHPVDFLKWSDWNGIVLRIEHQEVDESELERRLKRAKGYSKEEYVYRIERLPVSEALEFRVPGEEALAAALITAVGLTRDCAGRVRGFPRRAASGPLLRAITRMGMEVSTTDDGRTGNRESAILELCGKGELAGKRFGGGLMRSCPELLFVLAPLGMIASDKTVIRDLPFGSRLWRQRVTTVREILESCNARIAEIEDGVVIEGGGELMLTTHVETPDRLCNLMQNALALALPHHSSYVMPDSFNDSWITAAYRGLAVGVV